MTNGGAAHEGQTRRDFLKAGVAATLAARALRSGPVEGAQTHRSWWVARHAVRGVRKGEGRIGLLLPDGREVPVSRAYARDLRAAGWI